MKFLFFFALFGAVTAIDYTDCSDATYKAKLDSVTASPDPPTKKNNNTIGGKGSVLVDVTNATFELLIKLDGIRVADQKGDACKAYTISLPLGSGSVYYPGFNCPMKANDPISFNTYVTLTPLAPEGQNVDTVLTTALPDGTGLLCVEIKFKITEDMKGRTTPIPITFNH